MKPRTRFEKAILAESKNLRPITRTQCKWAFRECIDHFAYRLPKGRTTCMDCGHSWIMDKPTEHCTCPHCRAKLQVRTTYEHKMKQKQYFTTLTICGEYQVLRMFLLSSEMEKGCKAQHYTIEIGQYWWDAQGRKAVIAVQRTLGRYIDTFSFCSPMAIRNDNEAYQYAAYSPIYPKFKATDTLRRNGFKDDFHGIAPTRLIPALLSDSRSETLMKAKRYKDLRYFLSKNRGIDNYWDAYKLVLRHDYEISDIALWCDYIDMLKRLGKDTHNPKFVCPPDLITEHDKREGELRRQHEKEEIKRKLQKAIEDEELILSATIEGNRIETIEVNLDTLQVVQSRGICNKNTKYHEQIINLVNANRKLIRQRMKVTA